MNKIAVITPMSLEMSLDYDKKVSESISSGTTLTGNYSAKLTSPGYELAKKIAKEAKVSLWTAIGSGAQFDIRKNIESNGIDTTHVGLSSALDVSVSINKGSFNTFQLDHDYSIEYISDMVITFADTFDEFDAVVITFVDDVMIEALKKQNAKLFWLPISEVDFQNYNVDDDEINSVVKGIPVISLTNYEEVLK
jgi:hypothetical protein